MISLSFYLIHIVLTSSISLFIADWGMARSPLLIGMNAGFCQEKEHGSLWGWDGIDWQLLCSFIWERVLVRYPCGSTSQRILCCSLCGNICGRVHAHLILFFIHKCIYQRRQWCVGCCFVGLIPILRWSWGVLYRWWVLISFVAIIYGAIVGAGWREWSVIFYAQSRPAIVFYGIMWSVGWRCEECLSCCACDNGFIVY